ncbi:potassium channel family protein [Pontimonas sp.]|nr:potassium channel family protein [Pontimonas sp.]MDA8863176.1 potassium channel family protein [Pontimonas sp.]
MVKKPARKSSETPNRLTKTLDRLEIMWLILGVVYLASYITEVLAEPTGLFREALVALGWTIYAIFVTELIARIIASWHTLTSVDGLLQFARQYWLSVLAAILPAFRILRFLRVIIVLRAFQPFLARRTHRLAFLTGVTVPLLLLTAAVTVLDAERDASGANITSFGDALWWSLASITTVGYGDRYPVTDEGRLVATFLMIIGIGLFGSLTALLAAWVLKGDQETPEK